MLQSPSKQTCPSCQLHELAPSAVGLMCPGCGHIEHAVQPPNAPAIADANTEDDFVPTSPLGDTRPIRGLINHRRSSHYQKRLDERRHELEVPELPSPVHEELLPPSLQPTQLESPQSPTAIDTAPTLRTPPPLDLRDHGRPKSPLTLEDPKLAAVQAELLLSSAQTKGPATSTSRGRIIGMAVASVGLVALSGFILTQSLRQGRITPAPTVTVTPTPTNVTQSVDAKQRDAQRKTDLNVIAVGLEAYKKSQGAYPVGTDITVLYPLQKTTPPYIEAVPNDPLTQDENSAALRYGYTSDGTSFTLTAILENKQDSDLKNGLYSVKNSR